jgi:hypothetical protein
VPWAATLHCEKRAKVGSSLTSKGLAREIRAKADAPVWHENEDGRFALKITRAGREAIGVDDEETRDTASPSAAPVATKSKQTAVKPAAEGAQKAPASGGKGRKGETAKDAPSAPGEFRAGSKQAKIVDLMKRPKGATLDELV